MMAAAKRIDVPEEVTRSLFQGSNVLDEVATAHRQYRQTIDKATHVLDQKREATTALATGLAKLSGLSEPVVMVVTGSGKLVVQEAANTDENHQGLVQYPPIAVLRERAAKVGAKIDDLPPQAKQKIVARIEEAEAKAHQGK